MRPLFYEFPDQSNLFAIEDEYMVSKIWKIIFFYFVKRILQVVNSIDIRNYKGENIHC